MRVEERVFVGAAVAALPRIAEVISGYAPDERPGALEVAERRFIEAALDYGCTEIAAPISRFYTYETAAQAG